MDIYKKHFKIRIIIFIIGLLIGVIIGMIYSTYKSLDWCVNIGIKFADKKNITLDLSDIDKKKIIETIQHFKVDRYYQNSS